LKPEEPVITVSDRVDDAIRAELTAGLEAASLETVGPFRPEPLAILLHDVAGRLVGGLIGRSLWGWLTIELLWIDPSLRGAGHGRRLMARAEAEARRRGCHHARLDTYSFQAPGFYEKCGYRRVGTLEDFPIGHARHVYAKQLD
jgi:GNAT superfamily N-acetyltransferase